MESIDLQTLHQKAGDLANRFFQNDGAIPPVMLAVQFTNCGENVTLLPPEIAANFLQTSRGAGCLQSFISTLLNGQFVPFLNLPWCPDCIVTMHEADISREPSTGEHEAPTEHVLVIAYLMRGDSFFSMSPFLFSATAKWGRSFELSTELSPFRFSPQKEAAHSDGLATTFS